MESAWGWKAPPTRTLDRVLEGLLDLELDEELDDDAADDDDDDDDDNGPVLSAMSPPPPPLFGDAGFWSAPLAPPPTLAVAAPRLSTLALFG